MCSPAGLVRLEQKNDTLLEMGIYDDGPFEVGDESIKDANLVPTPPNSYLGKSKKPVRSKCSPPGTDLSLVFQASHWTQGSV